MQSTGVPNLGIGLTGIKENRGPTCHICVLLVPPFPLSSLFSPSRRRCSAPDSSRRRTRPCAATTPRRRPCTPSPALYAPPRPRSSAAASARRQRHRRLHFARVPPTCATARASVAKRRRATHYPRLHTIHTAAAASMPPSLHTVHAAAAAAPRSPSVRGFA